MTSILSLVHQFRLSNSPWHCLCLFVVNKYIDQGKRSHWEANPERFFEQFGSNPDRLQNLHFSFVVMLRALGRAAPILSARSFEIGSADEDRRVKLLVQRLLDSTILNSCSEVFSGFDESLLFQTDSTPRYVKTWKDIGM
jgi:hypothetical protein